MNSTIGKNVKFLREKLGLTQTELGKYLGVTRMQITRYENGENSIPTERLSKLAHLFSVDEYDFYEEDNSKIDIHLAFAFRAGEVKQEDLNIIAMFKNIAMNYLKMKELLKCKGTI